MDFVPIVIGIFILETCELTIMKEMNFKRLGKKEYHEYLLMKK